MNPAVSVVIPVYNAETLISRSVTSALAQTHQDLEVVVVDDASTDGTWGVLQQWADHPKVHLHRNDVNLGMGGNWDRAWSLATGRYLKLLCADDELYPTCVERQVSVLDAEPGVALVASTRDVCDTDGRVLLRGWGLRGLDGTVTARVALKRIVRSGTNQIGEPTAVLVRREAAEAAGTWEIPDRYLTDLDMWFRLLQRGDLHAIQEPLCMFRVWPGSLSTQAARAQARQIRDFFRRVQKENPTSVSRLDVLVGASRAVALQRLRRMTFWRASRTRSTA